VARQLASRSLWCILVDLCSIAHATSLDRTDPAHNNPESNNVPLDSEDVSQSCLAQPKPSLGHQEMPASPSSILMTSVGTGSTTTPRSIGPFSPISLPAVVPDSGNLLSPTSPIERPLSEQDSRPGQRVSRADRVQQQQQQYHEQEKEYQGLKKDSVEWHRRSSNNLEEADEAGIHKEDYEESKSDDDEEENVAKKGIQIPAASLAGHNKSSEDKHQTLPPITLGSPEARPNSSQKRNPVHLSPQNCNAKKSRMDLDTDTELARALDKQLHLHSKLDFTLFSNGKRGLRNLGNTCYMNACLQCLGQCGPLAEYFLQNKHMKDLNRDNISAKGAMAETYGKLVNAMWTQDSLQAIRPSKIKKVMGAVASYFEGYEQHDAQELLRCLLDAVHEDVNRIREKVPYEEIVDIDNESVEDTAQRWWSHYEKRNDSHVKDVFAGQLYSLVTCKTCGNQSRAFDPVLDLSVPIASPESGRVGLEECLQKMVEEETLDGDNACYCRKCTSHQPSTRRLEIFRAPDVLVIHLKRFAQVSPLQRKKLQTRVQLPLESTLDISPYCHKGLAAECPEYKLFGMVNHMGSLSGGHYTANARHVRTQVWHNFNDDRVTNIDPGNIDTSSAYLLFLERVRPVEVETKSPRTAHSHL